MAFEGFDLEGCSVLRVTWWTTTSISSIPWLWPTVWSCGHHT